MIASRGATMAVDWEQRVDFARLRRERLERTRAALTASDLGGVLLFDQNNIRYVTSTHIGEWARDKSARCVLLPRVGDPVLWDFGSAARHHQLYAPWLPDSSWRAGVSSMRGAMPQQTGVPDLLAGHIHEVLSEHGLDKEPLGIDLTDMETLASLHRQNIPTANAQPVMLAARKIKTEDEIALLDHAAAIVDAVYERIYELLRPGVREHEIVAEAQRLLFELGSEQVEAINAVSGDRCNPHPHVFSDRLLPRVEMRCAVHLALQEQRLHRVLEAADQQHPAVELGGLRVRRRLGGLGAGHLAATGSPSPCFTRSAPRTY
jgi:Xaa-Pro aminopeptidase